MISSQEYLFVNILKIILTDKDAIAKYLKDLSIIQNEDR
jgi:hypothetical protein